jgi:hypothetical protein
MLPGSESAIVGVARGTKTMPDLLRQRLEHCSDVQWVLDCALSRSLEVSGTGLGNVQLMDWERGCLTIGASAASRMNF